MTLNSLSIFAYNTACKKFFKVSVNSKKFEYQVNGSSLDNDSLSCNSI